MYRDLFASVPAVSEERRMGREVTGVFKRGKEEDWRWLTGRQVPPYPLKKKSLY